MTEADWLTSTDPAMLLRHLTRQTGSHGETAFNIPREPPIVSERKLSLWAAACWRLITPHEPIHEARALDVETGYRDWQSMVKDLFPSSEYSEAHDIVCRRLYPTWAALLRCVAGNPWRPVTLPGVWRTQEADVVYATAAVGDGPVTLSYFDCPWLTAGAVSPLAQTIYEERRWDALPILAMRGVRHFRSGPAWRPAHRAAGSGAVVPGVLGAGPAARQGLTRRPLFPLPPGGGG